MPSDLVRKPNLGTHRGNPQRSIPLDAVDSEANLDQQYAFRSVSPQISMADPVDLTTDDTAETVRLVVVDGETETELTVERGRVLRDVLLEAGLSPYSRLTERANCGGRGICATCGVRVAGVQPDHWHDRLAERFGYPRLSCQIAVDQDLRVELVEKVVWGSRQ